MNLDDIRVRIDSLDKELIKLLDERMGLSVEVANTKIISNAPILSNEREQIILDRIDQMKINNIPEIKAVMQSVMAMSREKQYQIMLNCGKEWNLGKLINNAKGKELKAYRIAYCGKEGSYSEAAATKMYPNAVIHKGYLSFADACKAVVSNEMDIAVLPLENTTAGTVNDVYDLIPINNLYIVKSMSDMISHNLLALPEADLSDIRTVISHPQALSQCNILINSKGWKTVEFNNTAYAAEEVRKKGDRSIAAISSAVSAKVYGLKILDVNVNNEECNQTRFVAISKNLHIEDTARKISIAFKLPHKTGSLSSVLFMFSGLSLNLTKIQSRPITNRPWEYIFYVDFVFNNENNALQALYQLEKELPEVIMLGWYGDSN